LQIPGRAETAEAASGDTGNSGTEEAREEGQRMH
jgi:hypothetical protein